MLDFHLESVKRQYERTLCLTMYCALHRLYPGQRCRAEHSFGRGVLFKLPGREITSQLVHELEAEMRRLIGLCLPITKRLMTREDAIVYFEAEGRADKAALLRTQQNMKQITLYGMEGYYDDCFGDVLPSTGDIPYFSIFQTGESLVLQMPSAENPCKAEPVLSRPKTLQAFEISERFCEKLHVLDAVDLTVLQQRHELREMIRINEALHDKEIASIANEIVKRNSHIVFVAGPSSSGKTTFSARLGVHLRVLGKPFLRVSMDDYYLDRSERVADENGKIDYETIYALDIPLLLKQLHELRRGESVRIPGYDFHTGNRIEPTHSTELSSEHVIIVEGIHALNPMLMQGMEEDDVYRIFVSALTCINQDDHNRTHMTDVRLLRRIVRDHQFRGTLPVDTMKMWADVRAGEDQWILPFQENADFFFNSTLHYEIPVLKMKAMPLLKEESCLAHPLTQKLLKLLECFCEFEAEMMDEIPPMSLLREFVGGCTAEKK